MFKERSKKERFKQYEIGPPNQPNTKEVGFAFLKVLMTNMAMSMATHVKFNAFVLGKAKEQK